MKKRVIRKQEKIGGNFCMQNLDAAKRIIDELLKRGVYEISVDVKDKDEVINLYESRGWKVVLLEDASTMKFTPPENRRILGD
jgi:hypothetical protein